MDPAQSRPSSFSQAGPLNHVPASGTAPHPKSPAARHDPSPNEGTDDSIKGFWRTAAADVNEYLLPEVWSKFNNEKGKFAETVLQGKGKVDYSVRKKFNKGDNYWVQNDNSFYTLVNGHYYLAINSIETPSASKLVERDPTLNTKKVMEIVGANINQLFPWGGNQGGDGKKMKLGETYDLTNLHFNIMGYDVPTGSGNFNQVRVVFLCDYFFVFQTTWRHALNGIAIHGILQDSLGEFWMFQEGYGSQELPYVVMPVIGMLVHLKDTTLMNYPVARNMWKEFAENTRNCLAQKYRPLTSGTGGLVPPKGAFNP